MAGQPPETVLIIDDDEAKRHSIAKILRRAGYTIREGMSAQFRAEIFNLCNHPIFPLDPDINPASTTFGKILRSNGQTNVPRQIELALRFTF